MPPCEQEQAGVDICLRFGSQHRTDGYGFVPGCGSGCWTAISEQDGCFGGNRLLYGCGEGCWSCLDYPQEVSGQVITEGGHRWLRPKNGMRNAQGMVSDLRSGVPQAIFPNMLYEKAPVFNQDGTECFNMSPCQAFPPPIFEATNGQCGGLGLGSVITGDFPDAFTYVGNEFGDQVRCRQFGQRGPNTVVVVMQSPSRMPEPVFIRSNEVNGPASCMSNTLEMCLGQVVSGNCQGDWLNEPTNPTGSDHPFWLQNNGKRDDFQFCDIVTQDIGLNVSGVFPFEDVSVLQVKRAALQHLMTVQGLKATRTTTFNFVTFDTFQRGRNAGLSDDNVHHWVREWNPFRDTVLMSNHAAPQVVVNEVTAELLHNPDAIVIVTLRMLLARMDLEMWAVRRVANAQQDATEWHMRCNIDIELAWIVSGPGITTNTEEPNILPTAPPGDRLIYRYNGKAFIPPKRATWQGYMGKMGQTPTEINLAGLIAGTVFTQCDSVLGSINSERLEGWPVLKDSRQDASAGLYTGGMTFNFRDL